MSTNDFQASFVKLTPGLETAMAVSKHLQCLDHTLKWACLGRPVSPKWCVLTGRARQSFWLPLRILHKMESAMAELQRAMAVLESAMAGFVGAMAVLETAMAVSASAVSRSNSEVGLSGNPSDTTHRDKGHPNGARPAPQQSCYRQSRQSRARLPFQHHGLSRLSSLPL